MKRRTVMKKDRIRAAVVQAVDTVLNHEERCYIHPEVAYRLITSLMDIADAVGDDACTREITRKIFNHQ